MTSANILIVENESVVARNLEARLKRLDYSVQTIVSTAEEAITKTKEFRPDLVLMDIKLNGNGDGVEAAEEIQKNMGIPVVYVTAHTDEDTMQRAKITEPFGYIHKPVDIRELRNTIELALYRHEMVGNLSESEARFRDLLGTLPNIAVQGYDRKGIIQFWNRASEEMFGYSNEEVKGKNFTDLIIPEEEREGVRTSIEEKLATGRSTTPTEQWFQRKDGLRLSAYTNYLCITHENGEPEIFDIEVDMTIFKNAQKSLMERERLFRSLTENVSIGVYRYVPGPNGKFIEANPAALSLFGYENKNEFLGLKADDLFVHEDERIRFDEKRRKDGFVKNVEITLKRKSGEHFIGSVSAVSVIDSDNNVRYYDGIIEDITQTKNAELEQQQSLSLLNATLESTADGILVADGKGDMVKFNRQFAELWKIPEEILSSRGEKKALEFVLTQLKDPDGFLKKVMELYDTPEKESFDVLEFRDGRIIERYSKPQTIEDRIVGRVWSFRDVTDRMTSKKELELEKVYFEALFHNAPEAVVLAENDGRIRRINEEFTRIFGWSNQEVKGKFVEDIIARGDHRSSAREITLKAAKGEIESIEAVRFHKDGTEIPVSIIGSPIFIGEGQVGVYAIYRDIREWNRASKERESLNAELRSKNDELQQVVYVTSHDLRSPLVNIKGFGQELEKSMGTLVGLLGEATIPEENKHMINILMRDEIPEALGYINSSIEKIESLLNGLLRISRLGTEVIDIQELDMNSLVTKVAENFEYRLTNKEIRLDIGELPMCMGDQNKVDQVFSNLLDNAVKYLDPIRPGEIRITGKQDDGRVLFSVSDNGIGIPTEHQEKIFQLFHRIDKISIEGEGLGLTVVRKILERNGGKIWVESEPGAGSTFFVSLPPSPPTASSPRLSSLPME